MKNKFKKKKMSEKEEVKFNVGDKVYLKPTPSGIVGSGNGLVCWASRNIYTVSRVTKTNSNRYGTTGQVHPMEKYSIVDDYGQAKGFVYSYEMELAKQTKEEILKDIDSLEKEIKCLKDKLDWMNEIGSDEYVENEFKVHQTLKALENNGLSLKKKTKLIVSLINGNKC